MNKTIIIATALLAGTTALIAFLRNRKFQNRQQPAMPAQTTRHLTDVFSKAKMG